MLQRLLRALARMFQPPRSRSVRRQDSDDAHARAQFWSELREGQREAEVHKAASLAKAASHES